MQPIKITKTKPILIIHGQEGVGKTTFATQFEQPIFIRTESGLVDPNIPTFPIISSYDEMMEALSWIGSEEHEFKTVVIDTIDWLEPLVWEQTCRRLGVASIEAPGYGRGYVEADKDWRTIIDSMQWLVESKDMGIVLIAHTAIVRIEDPMTSAYDKFMLKLHKRAASKLIEMADVVGYAYIDTMTKTEKGGFGSERARAVTTGVRKLRLGPHPAVTAKNRYGLPEIINLDYDEYKLVIGDE